MSRENLIWKFYGRFYDALLELAPYKHLLSTICSSVNPKPGKRYLDAGCGTGNLTNEIKEHGAEIIGVDYSESMLNKAQNKFKNIPFAFGDLNKKLEFDNDHFDGIASNNVLAYVKDLNFTLREFHRVLKPGGKIVLATLKQGFSPLKIYLSHIREVGFLRALKTFLPMIFVGLCNIIILQSAGRGIYHLLTKEELEHALKENGFKNIQITNAYADQDLLATCEK